MNVRRHNESVFTDCDSTNTMVLSTRGKQTFDRYMIYIHILNAIRERRKNKVVVFTS